MQGDGQIIQHDGWAAAKLMLLYNYGPLSTHSASDSHHLPVSKWIIYIWHVYGIKQDESEYLWTLGLQDDAFGRESKFFKGKKKVSTVLSKEINLTPPHIRLHYHTLRDYLPGRQKESIRIKSKNRHIFYLRDVFLSGNSMWWSLAHQAE